MAQTNIELLAEELKDKLTATELSTLRSFSKKILNEPYKSWFLDMTMNDLKDAIGLTRKRK